jgi:hypothetical protein
MLVLVGSCGSEWIAVSIPLASKGRVASVHFPLPPDSSRGLLHSASGELEILEYFCGGGRALPPLYLSRPAFSVRQTTLGTPELRSASGVPETLVRAWMEGGRDPAKAQESARRAIRQGDCVGLEVDIETRGTLERFRFCRVDNDLIVMYMIGTYGKVDGRLGRRFFGSFGVSAEQ